MDKIQSKLLFASNRETKLNSIHGAIIKVMRKSANGPKTIDRNDKETCLSKQK